MVGYADIIGRIVAGGGLGGVVGYMLGASIGCASAPVRGFTTTAGILLVTAIALCAGCGLYGEAGAVTGLGVLALAARRRSRDEDVPRMRHRISIVMGENAAGVPAMVDVLNEVGASVTEIDCHRHLHVATPVFVTLGVRRPDRIPIAALVAELESQPGVRRVHVHSAA